MAGGLEPYEPGGLTRPDPPVAGRSRIRSTGHGPSDACPSAGRMPIQTPDEPILDFDADLMREPHRS